MLPAATAGTERSNQTERIFDMFKTMLLIRAFDEAAHQMLVEGLVHGSVHQSIGQEAVLAGGFAKRVQEHGVCWTVDQVLTDVDRHAATLEWTRFNRQRDRLLRGVDWFVFEPQTFSIQEVRCYWATLIDPDMVRQELLDFDYARRGYRNCSRPRND